MIYEVRTYTLRPGTLAEFEERYEKRLPLREKHSKLGAFWHTEFGPLNQVIHVYPYDDLQHRTRVRAAMAQDAERNAMPGGGEFIAAQEAEIMNPAPFMRPLGSRNYGTGNVYEMRTYTYAPGDIPKVLDAWGKAIEARERFSPLAACWTSELGTLNKFTHIWVYKDLNERARVREESRRPGGAWPPKAGVWPVRQENKLLIPASFSPGREPALAWRRRVICAGANQGLPPRSTSRPRIVGCGGSIGPLGLIGRRDVSFSRTSGFHRDAGFGRHGNGPARNDPPRAHH